MKPPRPPSDVVHIVDDDEAVRRSLSLLLFSSGYDTQTHASAEEFLDALRVMDAACVIADVRMPGMDGVGMLHEMRNRGSKVPVIIVTGHADIALAVRAMKHGAVDFNEKPYSAADILAATASALRRNEAERKHRAAMAEAAARIATLTGRETEVFMSMVAGSQNKNIAHDLGISPRTVEIHRANIMEKLACRNLADVVRLALTAGVSSKVP